MFKNLKYKLQKAAYLGVSWVCRKEYKTQKFVRFNERPVEFAFLFRVFSNLYPQRVLDIGTGKTALPHLMRNCGALVTAADNITDYWPQGMINRHYHILDDDITKTRLKESYDLITCISVLEHIEDHQTAVQNMIKLLKPGGHLVLTCPYHEREYQPNVYQLPDSSYGQKYAFITQSFSRNELNHWLEKSGGVLIEQEFWQFWEGKHWTVGQQQIPPKKVQSEDRHQLTCLLIQKPE